MPKLDVNKQPERIHDFFSTVECIIIRVLLIMLLVLTSCSLIKLAWEHIR